MAGASVAPSGGTGGPQPGIVHGGEGYTGSLGGARAAGGVHQRESEGAISGGKSGTHGAADGRGAVRGARGSRQRKGAGGIKIAVRQSAICGKFGSEAGAVEGPSRGGCHGAICAGKAH